MKKRLVFADLLTNIASFSYLLSVTAVLAVVSFCYRVTDFYLKTKASPTLLDRGFPCMAAALVILAAVFLRQRKPFPSNVRFKWILFGSLFLFAWQTLVLRHAWFMSRGDDVYYVLGSSLAYGRKEYQFIENAYLELCPNNISLSALYGLLLRAFMFITRSEPGPERFRMLIIFMQSAVNVSTCLLVAAAAKRVTGSKTLSLWTWTLCVLLVGLSPRFLIPYSDSTALAFPVLLFLLWTCLHENKNLLLSALFGLLSGFAYIIKPHAMIPAIAALICAILGGIRSPDSIKRRLASTFTAVLCAVLLIFPANRMFQNSMHLKIDPNAGLNAAHYFNMGLNTETSGCFSDEDRSFACSFPTLKERTRGCLRQAIKRLSAMGPSGLMQHAVKKCLVNNADGTFGWNLDFNRQPSPPRNALSPILRSIVYEDGEAHRVLATIQQIAWQLVLLLLPFAELARRKASGLKREAIFMLMLSCLGILMFNMLLEAKGRYVYTLVPLFCLLAVCSGEALFLSLKERFRR